MITVAGRPAVLVFAQHGVPCGMCGLPAHHIKVYPNGVRTDHIDPRKRPCDFVRSAASSRPGRRGSEPPPPHDLPRLPRRSGFPPTMARRSL